MKGSFLSICVSSLVLFECYGAGVYISYENGAAGVSPDKRVVCFVRHEGTDVQFHEHNDAASITRRGCSNAAMLGHDLRACGVSSNVELYYDNTCRCRQTANALNVSMEVNMNAGGSDGEVDLGLSKEGRDFIGKKPGLMHSILQDVCSKLPDVNDQWEFLLYSLLRVERSYGHGAANVVSSFFHAILGKDVVAGACGDACQPIGVRDIAEQYIDEVKELDNVIAKSRMSVGDADETLIRERKSYIVVHHSVFMSFMMFYGTICNGRELSQTMSDIRAEVDASPMALRRYMEMLECCLLHYRPKHLNAMCVLWGGTGDRIDVSICSGEYCQNNGLLGGRLEVYSPSLSSSLLQGVYFAFSSGLRPAYEIMTAQDTLGHKDCLLRFKREGRSYVDVVCDCLAYGFLIMRRCLPWCS